ncbi:MAG: hypothetical protein ABIP51_16305 [Bacteroidia bacterium]
MNFKSADKAIDSLVSKFSELKNEIERLENEVNEKVKEIEALNDDLNSKPDYDEQDKKIDSLNDSLYNLVSQNLELTKEVENLQKRLDKYE